jgi:hypothetical protein
VYADSQFVRLTTRTARPERSIKVQCKCTFNQPRTYTYFCASTATGMTGMVTVSGAAVADRECRFSEDARGGWRVRYQSPTQRHTRLGIAHR